MTEQSSAVDPSSFIVHQDISWFLAYVRDPLPSGLIGHTYAAGSTRKEACDRLAAVRALGTHGASVPFEIWSKQLVEPVAQGFVRSIHEEMMRYTDGIERYQAIVDRNRAQTGPSICHTRDFCDANVFMAFAVQAFTGRDLAEDSMFCDAGSMELWHAAWQRAKEIMNAPKSQEILGLEARIVRDELPQAGKDAEIEKTKNSILYPRSRP